MVGISWLVVATMVACSLTLTENAPFFGLFYDICDDCSEESGGVVCDLLCETVECSSEEPTTAESITAGETTSEGETTASEGETTIASDNAETTAGGDESTTAEGEGTTAGEETTTAADA